MMTRFARFNVVGAIGFAVQLTLLVLLERAGLPVALATLVAVELTIVHNFIWHERWTWAGVAPGSAAARLARFHVSNGLISLAGNVVITSFLAGAGVALVAANIAAVMTCAVANFAVAHLWVFCAKTWPTFHGHLH